MSDSDDHHILRVITDADDVAVTVFNGWEEPVKTEDGEAKVPPGLYTVRVEREGRINEHTVKVTGSRTVEIAAPKLYSAAPLADLGSSHEYYTDPAIDYSHTETRSPIGPAPHESRLLVFLRAPTNRDRSDFHKIGRNFEICDADGEVLSTFDDQETARNDTDGWVAFAAKAAPGDYLLRHCGERKREIPLTLPKGWAAQLFITHHRRPLLEGMSMFLSQPGEGFTPSDREARATDRALNALHNGQDEIRGSAMEYLLYGKFENPMYGLVGLHLLLCRKKVDTGLVDMVVRNLRQMLGDIPDVQALEVMVAERVGRPHEVDRVHRPPMLLAGLKGIVRASWDQANLVPAESVVEEAATGALGDGAWTSWIAGERPLYAATRERHEKGFPIPKPLTLSQDPPPGPLWIAAHVHHAVEESEEAGPTPLELAKQMNVPVTAVKRVMDWAARQKKRAVVEIRPPEREDKLPGRELEGFTEH